MGMVPSTFWQATRQDQAYIMARSRVKSTMQAFDDEMNKKPKKKK